MKKVLSFVLVLAMILGSVSMAFAFTDDAAITNTEAAKVLNAAGILEGYTDGSFKADQVLTRAEGTAIIARMLLGKSDAAKLSTVVNPFNDVAATDWCAGYIAYCVSQGIINGYGNGNFGPNDPLTVAAFGKMCLTALGYNSQNQGFVGENWESNVGSVMVKAGLTDGITVTNGAGCSRGVAAQVSLNTLKATLVNDNSTGTTVSAGNVTVVTGKTEAKKLSWTNASDREAGDKENYLNEGVASLNAPIRFMNRYQKKLKYEASNNAFGYPESYKWSYDGKKAYTKSVNDDLIGSYTTKQTYKTLQKLLKDHDAIANDVTSVAFYNGNATTVAALTMQGTTNFPTTSTNFVGNGTQIDVFYNSGAKKVTIVGYDYFLVKAAADYSSKNESVKVSAVSDLSGMSMKAGWNELKKEDFSVEDVKEDDYLVVTIANGEVKSVSPATKVTGTVASYTNDSNITVDGTKYTKAARYYDVDNATSVAFTGLATGTDVTIVVDKNNFVLTTTEEVSKDQYVYIYRVGSGSSLEDEGKAVAYFVDGTRQIITTDNTVAGGAWYNYSVKSNGKYKLTTIGGVAVAASPKNITAEAITYNTGYANANNATVVIAKKTNETSANAKVYTGYKNIPGATGATAAAVVKNGYSKYVFIEAGNFTGGSSSDYVLAYKKGNVETITNNDTTYLSYGKTFKNGVQGTTEFEEASDFASKGFATGELYVALSYDADGRVSTGTAVLANTTEGKFSHITGITNVDGVVVYKEGVLTLNGGVSKTFALNEAAKAYIIDGDDVDTVQFSSIKGNLDTGATYSVFVQVKDAKDADILNIYFIKQ